MRSYALALLCAPAVAVTQAPSSVAQTARPAETFVHESWTVQDGLPVNSVNALLQSHDGYIWIATFDGLARFDGIHFTVFNSATSPGLPNNRIIALDEARDGTLWLRTEDRQLVRFRDGRFTAFGRDRGIASDVWTIFEDRTSTIWVGTQRGLGVIRDDRFVRVAAASIDAPVFAITQRADGSIWAGVEGHGLFRIDGDRVAPAPGQPDELARGGIQAMAEDSAGTLWLGVRGPTGAGIWRFGNRTEWVARTGDLLAFSVSRATGIAWGVMPNMIYRLEAGRAVEVQPRVGALYHTQVLVQDDSGKMLYTSGTELYRDGRRIYTLPSLPRAGPTSSSSITAIMQDHEGSIWLGTWGNGLHRLKPATFTVIGAPEGLSADNVYSVYEDAGGAIWVGTLDGGMSRIDGDRVTRVAPSTGNSRIALSFMQDRTGRLWIAGIGLIECALPNVQCTLPSNDVARRAQVHAMYEDSTGALWFGSDVGLLRLEGDRWTTPPVGNADRQPVVRAFERSPDGALWMATAGEGLLRYQDGRFRSVTTAEGLPFDRVRSLHVDQDGWLWVGTEGRGLARLDPRDWQEGKSGGRIVSVRARDGLFDEVIHTILEDSADRLWMSGNRGIFWVDRRELLEFAAGRRPSINSTAYTERDGLRNREANGGSQPAAIRSRDGRLWFATQGGVAIVDPARIERNPIPPNVVVEQVLSGGTALPAGRGRMSLGTAQRDLEIRYTALSFLAPANMRFRYRLEPYDAKWVDAGNRRTAFYTKVPPGRYTFRVAASNNDGVWNEQGAALELELAPHLWETGGFRLLSALTIGLIIAGGVGWRVRTLRARALELGRLVDERTRELRVNQHQLELRTEQLKELDRAKSRFFANVSHEFRTPLTLTIGPLEDLRARVEREPIVEPPRELDMALRNSRRLLRLVNQILDVAKLEAGQMKLRARRQDLATFARGVAAAFGQIAAQNHIDFEVIAPDAVDAWFDADALEKVLGNLLSNAFKFTPDGGRIALRVDTHDTVGRIKVTDSGPGIPPEYLPHVFERFYQVDESSTRAQPGTGIGLALARELVELHGGSITAESDGGATFTVELPLGRTHLRDDQIVGRPEDSPASTDGLEVEHAVTRDGDREPRNADAATDRTTLLIVDDSADMRAYVRSHFESRYSVLEAADGEAGIERAKSLLPDLVISDVMMPGVDGNTLCRTLKSDAETDFIPIILLTALASTENRVAGLVGGADDYLAKPFEMRELEARIENLIATRRRLRERFAAEAVNLPSPSQEPALGSADQAFVDRLYATIAAHLAEPEFGVAELAEQVFLDRSHLFRRTRELVGETPSDLLRRLRLERAAQLLKEGAGNVAEVAYAVGFQSLSHFSRSFRDAHGVSPSAYRDRVPPRR
jgi:signal transduction histidine kinase/ligand-binding sensor domain-containing protein/DNA-binding response OmpR family regulator